MKKVLWFLLAFPISVFALNYQRQSLLYTDAPFTPAEAAGISLLTNLGAVQGYPDGSFHPERTLNRAEFLKIALASFPDIRVSSSDADSCFPDVAKDDWFSIYVCLAKKRGIIGGYPDGTFKPANPVNYVEALKILGELYEYTAYVDPDAEWWQVYVQAAQNHKTILPVQLAYDRYITRGQMARLAAAYRAEYEGELEYYRQAEAGANVVVPSSPFSSPSSSSSSTSQTVSSVQSSSASSSVSSSLAYAVPTQSNILLVGRTHIIGDALLYPQQKNARLRIIKVMLDREARSLKTVYLDDIHGVRMATLKLDLYDRDNETWIAEFPGGSGSYLFPGATGTRVAVLGEFKDATSGGFSQDTIKVKSLFVVVEKADNPVETYQIVPTDAHYPAQQTALARITHVENSLQGTGVLLTGNNQRVAAFLFMGEDVGSTEALRIQNLRFHVHTSPEILISNPQIQSGTSQKHACSFDGSDTTIINCLVVPEEIGLFQGNRRSIEFSLNIDASQALTGARLQVNLENPGSLNESGDVQYTDGSNPFTWIGGDSPIALGKVWVK